MQLFWWSAVRDRFVYYRLYKKISQVSMVHSYPTDVIGCISDYTLLELPEQVEELHVSFADRILHGETSVIDDDHCRNIPQFHTGHVCSSHVDLICYYCSCFCFCSYSSSAFRPLEQHPPTDDARGNDL